MSRLGLFLRVFLWATIVLTLVDSQALSPGNAGVDAKKGSGSQSHEDDKKFRRLKDGEESKPGENFEYSCDDDSTIVSVGFKLVKTSSGSEDLVIVFTSRKLFISIRQVMAKRDCIADLIPSPNNRTSITGGCETQT